MSPPPLEGVVVIVIDTPDSAHRIKRALAQAGAAVFMAYDEQEGRAVLSKGQPQFAVIDPSAAGGRSPQSLDKSRPVSDVVGALIEMIKDPGWIAKGGDRVKPER